MAISKLSIATLGFLIVGIWVASHGSCAASAQGGQTLHSRGEEKNSYEVTAEGELYPEPHALEAEGSDSIREAPNHVASKAETPQPKEDQLAALLQQEIAEMNSMIALQKEKVKKLQELRTLLGKDAIEGMEPPVLEALQNTMPRTTLESLQSEEMLEDDNFHDFLALTTKLTVPSPITDVEIASLRIRPGFFPKGSRSKPGLLPLICVGTLDGRITVFDPDGRGMRVVPEQHQAIPRGEWRRLSDDQAATPLNAAIENAFDLQPYRFHLPVVYASALKFDASQGPTLSIVRSDGIAVLAKLGLWDRGRRLLSFENDGTGCVRSLIEPWVSEADLRAVTLRFSAPHSADTNASVDVFVYVNTSAALQPFSAPEDNSPVVEKFRATIASALQPEPVFGSVYTKKERVGLARYLKEEFSSEALRDLAGRSGIAGDKGTEATWQLLEDCILGLSNCTALRHGRSLSWRQGVFEAEGAPTKAAELPYILPDRATDYDPDGKVDMRMASAIDLRALVYRFASEFVAQAEAPARVEEELEGAMAAAAKLVTPTIAVTLGYRGDHIQAVATAGAAVHIFSSNGSYVYTFDLSSNVVDVPRHRGPEAEDSEVTLPEWIRNPGPPVVAMTKQATTLAVAAGNRVHFLNVASRKVLSSVCSVGEGVITSLAYESLHAGLIWAATNTGEAYLFDSRVKSARAKVSATSECKIIRKIQAAGRAGLDPVSKEDSASSIGHSTMYAPGGAEVVGVKGYLLGAVSQRMAAFNVTGAKNGLVRYLFHEDAQLGGSLPSLHEEGPGIEDLVAAVNGVHGTGGSILRVTDKSSRLAGEVYVAHSIRGDNTVRVYLSLLPYTPQTMDVGWFRFPIVLVGIALVIGYQVYQRRKKPSGNAGGPSEGKAEFDALLKSFMNRDTSGSRADGGGFPSTGMGSFNRFPRGGDLGNVFRHPPDDMWGSHARDMYQGEPLPDVPLTSGLRSSGNARFTQFDSFNGGSSEGQRPSMAEFPGSSGGQEFNGPDSDYE